jgi:hypothetical protein
MKECVREAEVVEALISGRWPDACDPELRSHAMDCHICKDIVLVSSTLQEDRDSAVLNAPLPSAGLVWWRAELRTRREAAKAAERPMKFVYSLAAASAAGVVVALLGSLLPFVHELLAAFANVPELGLLIGGLATLLVVAPIAVYFVFSERGE